MVTFEYLAPHYRWIESLVFGQSLQRCRTAWLDELKNAERLLIVGEGNGRFLCAFLAANSMARVDCLDISPRMLELAKLRIPEKARCRVNFIASDVAAIELAEEHYDAIVTNFFLDCFEADVLERVVEKLGRALRRGGLWIVGDFRRPRPGAAARRAELALKVMYLCFRIATRLPARELADPDRKLRAEDLELVEARQWQNGFLSAQLWRKKGFLACASG